MGCLPLCGEPHDVAVTSRNVATAHTTILLNPVMCHSLELLVGWCAWQLNDMDPD
jgi:hypothetical protein